MIAALVGIIDPTWSTVLLAFASSFFTIGLLSLSTEIFLRRRLLNEVLFAVGMNAEISQADVMHLLPGTTAF